MITFSETIKKLAPSASPLLLDYVVRALRSYYMYPDERSYHNWNHVENCLIELEQVNEEYVFEEKSLIAVALFYHDSIYEPLEKDNEERSAERAFIDLLALGFNVVYAKKVYDLIMLTRHAGTCDYFSGQLIMDIDLAILGKDYPTFEEYDRKIRKEYLSVPEEEYRVERIKVLVSFLKKPSIYQTQYFKNKYEESARSNILKIMDSLRQGISMKDLFPLQASE